MNFLMQERDIGLFVCGIFKEANLRGWEFRPLFYGRVKVLIEWWIRYWKL